MMLGWFCWLLGAASYFYQFVFRTIFSTLGDEITDSFKLDASELSTFFASGMLAYSLMQIPGGLLLDRFGPRKMLSLAMGLLSSGILLVSSTTHFELAILGRIFMGVGSAFAFVSTSKIVVNWFPMSKMGLLLGITVFLGGMGGAFSNSIYSHLGPADWDWRHSIFSMGTIGILLSVTMAIFLRERESVGEPSLDLPTEPLSHNIIQNILSIFCNKQILLVGMFAFFGYLPISIIADSWGPLAFEAIFKAPKELANHTVTYFYIPFACGALFYSSLASWLRNHKLVLTIEFIFVTLLLCCLLLFSEHIQAITIFHTPLFLIIVSLLGLNLGGISLCFPLGCLNAPPKYAGTVVGLINMLCMISGAIFSKLVGAILLLHWDGGIALDGSKIYSAYAYKFALLPLIISGPIALILLYFIQEKKTIKE